MIYNKKKIIDYLYLKYTRAAHFLFTRFGLINGQLAPPYTLSSIKF
jgi:hypothetical protein